MSRTDPRIAAHSIINCLRRLINSSIQVVRRADEAAQFQQLGRPCASSTSFEPNLPNHLQPKLYFSRGYCQLIDRTSAAAWSTIFIEKCAVVYRCQEGRVVEYIKEFRPNLDVEVLGDAPDVVVLEDREIEVVKAWPDHAVASHIAHQILTIYLTVRRWRRSTRKRIGSALRGQGNGRCWKSEAPKVDVVAGIAWTHRCATRRHVRKSP